MRRSARDPDLRNAAGHILMREQTVNGDLAEVFDFFARAHNLELLTPPWMRFQLTGGEKIEMEVGTLIHYRLRVHGIPMRWTSRIEEWQVDRAFTDVQLKGPYKRWHHRHEFLPGPKGTVVRDTVHYEIGFGPLGELAHALLVRRDLERIFDYRTEALARIFP